jgi:hypothetical protein
MHPKDTEENILVNECTEKTEKLFFPWEHFIGFFLNLLFVLLWPVLGGFSVLMALALCCSINFILYFAVYRSFIKFLTINKSTFETISKEIITTVPCIIFSKTISCFIIFFCSIVEKKRTIKLKNFKRKLFQMVDFSKDTKNSLYKIRVKLNPADDATVEFLNKIRADFNSSFTFGCCKQQYELETVLSLCNVNENGIATDIFGRRHGKSICFAWNGDFVFCSVKGLLMMIFSIVGIVLVIYTFGFIFEIYFYFKYKKFKVVEIDYDYQIHSNDDFEITNYNYTTTATTVAT